jgi:hypothetical protein
LVCWFVEVDEDFGRESSVAESDTR